jgi:hypothetical protein
MRRAASLMLTCGLLLGLASFVGCPGNNGPPGPFLVNQRDHALTYVVRDLRLPCALVEPDAVTALTEGDFLPPQSYRMPGRDVWALAQERCGVPLQWVTVGDFDGLVTIVGVRHDKLERMSQELFDQSLLVEGDKTRLYVTVGKLLRTFPPPPPGPPTLVLPPDLEPLLDGSLTDAAPSDGGTADAASDDDGGAGDAGAPDAQTPDGG